MRTANQIIEFYGYILLCCSLYSGIHTSVAASEINVTLDDTHPSIQYHPPHSWHTTSEFLADGCPLCLSVDPKQAYMRTWHHATNTNQIPDHNPNTHAKSSCTDKGGGTGRRKRCQMDYDLEGELYAQFEFTGSAIYLNSILPTHILGNPTPSTVNLTIILDSRPIDAYFHSPPPPPVTSSISSPPSTVHQEPHTRISTFSLQGLPHTLHTLAIVLAPGSSFIFDSLTYTEHQGELYEPHLILGDSASLRTQILSKRRNTTTFGIAIGICIGLLAILSLGTAISIFRRRRHAKLRDRDAEVTPNLNSTTRPNSVGVANENELQNRNSNGYGRGSTIMRNAEIADNRPRSQMEGPAPFIPRFFPGTVSQTNSQSSPTRETARPPPPYIPTSGLANGHSHENDHAPTLSLSSLSYADVPPPIDLDHLPPPLDDDDDDDRALPSPPGIAAYSPTHGIDLNSMRAEQEDCDDTSSLGENDGTSPGPRRR